MVSHTIAACHLAPCVEETRAIGAADPIQSERDKEMVRKICADYFTQSTSQSIRSMNAKEILERVGNIVLLFTYFLLYYYLLVLVYTSRINIIILIHWKIASAQFEHKSN